MFRSLLIFLIFFLVTGYGSVGLAEELSENQPIDISTENLLITEVFINKISTDDVVEVYQHDGGYLLPLGLMSDVLDFSIAVDTTEKTARGWFIEENRNFDLNLARGEVVVAGKKKPLDKRLIVVTPDDIYVDSSLFAEWFPLALELNLSDLVIYVKPSEKLPVQSRLERKNVRSKSEVWKEASKGYTEVKSPYKLFDVPIMDVDVGYDYANDQEPNGRLSYSMLAEGDMAYMTTQLAVVGDGQDSLTGLRLNAGRSDYEGKLLGKLKATSFLMGDINAVSMPMTTQNSSGRGFTMTNRDLDRPDQFDSTSFIGDSQPGWDVEIYRNGELLDFQTVGDDGRYNFSDIPVFFGNNIFRIVSYGPQGQIKEKVVTQLIDNSILKKGQLNYSVSVDEKAKSIFGVDEQNQVTQNGEGWRSVAGVEYGLFNNLTATAGVVRTPLEDGEFHDYQSVGLRSSVSGLFGSGMLTDLNFIRDSLNGGRATQLLAQARVLDINVRAEQSFYQDFISEIEEPTDQRRTSVSKLDLDGRLESLFPSGLSYRFGGEYEQFEDSRTISTLSNRLATSIYGLGFANNVSFSSTKSTEDVDERTDGDFSVRGRYRKTALRLSVDYDVIPEASLRTLSAIAQQQLGRNTNVRLGVRKDLIGDNLMVVDASLNRIFDHFTWSLVGSTDSENNYSLGTRVSFAVGREPRERRWFADGRAMASDGAVSAQAFLDHNYNDRFDEGDQLLSDVGFIAPNGRVTSKGEAPALIPRMPANSPTDVEIDFTTLEDPFWLPKPSGYRVNARPGVVTKVDFPVYMTTEIDGTVYIKDGRSEPRPLPRMIVEMVDSADKVVATTRSEFDGFYIFEGVIPGKYTLRIKQENLDQIKAAGSATEKLEVKPDSDIISGVDLFVTSAPSGSKAKEQ